jgi:uncharacterized protein
MMSHTLLSPDEQSHVPWRNGGGVSTIIADERLPGHDAGDWEGVVWQLSRTSIVAPGPFSDLRGFERLQTVIAGAGLFLDTPDGAIDLSRPLSVARYDGGTPIVSRLTKGPVEVLNLIARRERAGIDMRALDPGETLPAEFSPTLLYAFSARAKLSIDRQPFELPAAHALRLDAPAIVACRRGAVVASSIRHRRAS